MPHDKNFVTETEVAVPELIPPWLQTLRGAAAGLVGPESVKKMMQKQVELAEGGDRRAVEFVMKTAFGDGKMKGATVIVNNYYDGAAAPKRATKALPGTDEKIGAMRRRVAAGGSATRKGDAERDLE